MAVSFFMAPLSLTPLGDPAVSRLVSARATRRALLPIRLTCPSPSCSCWKILRWAPSSSQRAISPHRRGWLACRSSRSKDAAVLRIRLPLRGALSGVELWASDHLAAVGGSPSFFPSAAFPHGAAGDICKAIGWHPSANCCSVAHFSNALFALLALPPLQLSSQAASSLSITGRARARLPECANAWRWSEAEASVLGDWSTTATPVQKAPRPSAGVPTCKTYAPLSRGDRQLAVRRKMLRSLAALVQGKPWHECIPLQNCPERPVSYSFLSSHSHFGAAEEVEADGSDS